ncbi:hypothetical protein CEP54_013740 [Fusarium duplospermum]|uniref:Fungal N-terminal domain-containing protein n=1 Tax=Fusarium duplospermum TaxID=1325734 RepID=A0A428P0X6_9HYPO|nr:hypothetical protein CEP54_013740 [Fusarium duplospermum]
MAEALAAVGVVASLVQLTDASIRTCLCLYTFFSSMHNSQPDLHRHILVIRDVHDAIQLIRKTVSCQRLTETEGRALGDQLNNVMQELSGLEEAIAGKDPTRLRARVAWVLKSAETERALQRLENHKTTLVLLLQALNLGQSERILFSQTSTQTYLQCLVEDQKRNGAAMRAEVGKGMEELEIRMASLDSTFGLYQQSLKEGFSNMSHEIQVSEEHVGNMLRHELQRQLRPLVEEALTKSEKQNAAALEQFRAVVADATTQITRNIFRQGDREKQLAFLETDSTSNPQYSADPTQHFQHSMITRPVALKQKDCEVTIFDFLLSPLFCLVPPNRYEENDEEDCLEESVWEPDSDLSDRDSSSEPECKITDEVDQDDNDGLDDTDHSYHGLPPKVDHERYLADIRRLAEFLGRQGLDLLHHTGSELTDVLYESQRMGLPVLQQCGLDGNYTDPTMETLKPIIYAALCSLSYATSVTNEMENLVRIISTGADIYTVEWADDEWIEDVGSDGVMSPTALAKATDIVEEWEEALRRAGYDPKEVFIEDERRRREFRLLQGQVPDDIS